MKKENNISLGIIFVVATIVLMLFSGCYGTYYLSDAEYSDVRETHATVTHHQGELYWGWNEGFYYYYGTPHYYPWYYYYNACPPSHYTHTTHITITNPVNRPTHRPNIYKPNRTNTHRPNIRTNGNIKVKTNTRVTITPNTNTKVKTNTNYTRPNIKVKTNRSNTNRSNNNKKRTNTRKPK